MRSVPAQKSNPTPRRRLPLQRRHSGFSKTLKLSRRVHHTMGSLLFVMFVVVSLTGLLLGWKKHSGGAILPESHRGTSTNPSEWLPIHELWSRANELAHRHISPDLSLDLERIDIRPDKGVVKFVFIEDYWGLQLDCATGELLHIERRRSDFIENIHDGSIFDYLFQTSDEQVKLVYTTIGGLSLFLFSVTGFWMWFGPKRLRAMRRADARASHTSRGPTGNDRRASEPGASR